MKAQVCAVLLMAGFLGGCSDVTPQVTLLRSKPTSPQNSKYSGLVQTDLASVGKSTSQDGYQLHAVVSKEDKASPKTSRDGYILIQHAQED